jgi:hypothetical protein
MTMLELKLLKIRSNNEGKKGFKKADMMKCNEYGRLALGAFLHFIMMYSSSSSSSAPRSFLNTFLLNIDEIIPLFNSEPDNGIVIYLIVSYICK